LKHIDPQSKLYRTAGRMFVAGTQQEFSEDLAKTVKAYEEDIKIETDLKVQSDKKVEELTKAVQALMSKGK
jgi:chaperonin cofactor prefoldin